LCSSCINYQGFDIYTPKYRRVTMSYNAWLEEDLAEEKANETAENTET
jgi:hypothetical protein